MQKGKRRKEQWIWREGTEGNCIPKTNVILIVSDQHRFCDVGYMGNEIVATPNLDFMAEHGVVMENTYSCCPLCVPARGTIFTGLHALKHGAAANDMPVLQDVPSVPKCLSGAGYSIGLVGKWHLGGVPREKAIPKDERLGFEYWRGCNCNHEYLKGWYDDDENHRYKIEGYEPVGQTNLALEFLEKKKDESFFLSLCFGPPHDPYFELPEGALARFAGKDIPLRENAVNQKIKDFTLRGKNLKEQYAGYYAQISQLDIQIGRVLEWLKASGHEKDTIVIYTSDHGDMLGSHGFANKQIWYEESAHIPCVFYGPGLEPGRRKGVFSLLDLAPTIAGLCGVEMSGTDGRDLSSYVKSPSGKKQEYVYFYSYVPCHQASLRRVKSWRAVTDGRYKLVADDKRRVQGFYDLEEDPLELTDFREAKEKQADLTRLFEVLDREVAEHDGYRPYLELLKEHGILSAWLESERHFYQIWTFIPKVVRKLKMRRINRTEKKMLRGESN